MKSNFYKCEASKSAILTIAAPMKFSFSKCWPFEKVEISYKIKFRAYIIVKMAVLETLHFAKVDFT